MTVASIRYVSPWVFFFFSFFLSFHLYHSSVFFKLSLQCCGCRAEIIFPVFVTNTWSLSCLIQFLRNHWESWIVLLLCLNCYTFIKVIEIGKTMFLGLWGWSWGLGVLPQENWCFWQDISLSSCPLSISLWLLVSVNLQVLLVERGGADLEGGPAVLASS